MSGSILAVRRVLGWMSSIVISLRPPFSALLIELCSNSIACRASPVPAAYPEIRDNASSGTLPGRHDAAVFQLKEALSLSNNLFEVRESIIRRLEEIFAAKKALKELS